MIFKKSESNKKDLEFYNLCSNHSNEEKIKHFLNKEYFNGFSIKKFLTRKDSQFDNYGLTAGLLASIENGNDNYIELILDHVNDNKLNNQDYYSSMQLVFNCAAKLKKIELLKRLDKQFSLIGKSLCEPSKSENLEFPYKLSAKGYALVNQDGDVSLIAYRLYDDEIKDKLESYNQNPVVYNLINSNMEAINFMFLNDLVINKTLIEDGFLTSMVIKMTGGEAEPSLLVFNDKCRKVIEESTLINALLYKGASRQDIKKEIFAALEMVELKDELLNTQPIKKRMKI